MTDFPLSITNFGYTAAQKKGVPFDVVQKMMDEIVGMETAFISGRARCSAYHSTTQSLTTGTPAAMNFDSEDFDVGAMHDAVTNNNRVTIPANNAGIYLLVGGSTFAANATGFRELALRKNNATVVQEAIVAVNSGTQLTTFQVVAVVSLAAADFIDLVATQNSGGALTAGNLVRAFASFLQVVRIW